MAERRQGDRHTQALTADAKAWKEKRALPREFTHDSSFSNSISIHQELMLALLSKYIYPKSNHCAPRQPWSCQWLGKGVGMKHRDENQQDVPPPPPEKWGCDQILWDRSSLSRSLDQTQGNKQGFLEEGEAVTRDEREGKVFLVEGTAGAKTQRKGKNFSVATVACQVGRGVS